MSWHKRYGRAFGSFRESDPSEWVDPYAKGAADSSQDYSTPPMVDAAGNVYYPGGPFSPSPDSWYYQGQQPTQDQWVETDAPPETSSAGVGSQWAQFFNTLFANVIVPRAAPVQYTTGVPAAVVDDSTGSLLVVAGVLGLGVLLVSSLR